MRFSWQPSFPLVSFFTISLLLSSTEYNSLFIQSSAWGAYPMKQPITPSTYCLYPTPGNLNWVIIEQVTPIE